MATDIGIYVNSHEAGIAMACTDSYRLPSKIGADKRRVGEMNKDISLSCGKLMMSDDRI